MTKLHIILLSFLFAVLINNRSYSQGEDCASAQPFCTGTSYNFPLSVNTEAEVGPDYGCLTTQPNPVWYYLMIDDPGDLNIHMNSTPSSLDIDFVCWGPFNNVTCDYSLLSEQYIVDCSFDYVSEEDCYIPNASPGEYYMLCITNYSDQITDVELTQESGTGTTDCNIINCSVDNFEADTTLCNDITNEFSINGTISFSGVPLTGTLTITDDISNETQIFNAPFTSPQLFNIDGINSDGAPHTLNVAFSDSSLCVYDYIYDAPETCVLCSNNPGEDSSVCGNTYNLNALLNTSDINQNWTCETPGVIFNNSTSNSTTVSVPQDGVYDFIWTTTNEFNVTCSNNVTITFYQIPTSEFTITDINCFDDETTVAYTGNASLTANYIWDYDNAVTNPSGNGPHNIKWNNSGVHTISLSVEENGCLSEPLSRSITYPEELILTVSHEDIACSDDLSSISFDISGGTPSTTGYSYTWTPVINDFINVPAGNYTIVANDANACSVENSFSITVPNPMIYSEEHINLSCYNYNNGEININIQGGTQPYSYAWSNGNGFTSSLEDLSDLSSGEYFLTLTDNNGCKLHDNISLTQPDELVLEIETTNSTICIDGSADINASTTGGTPFNNFSDYNYLWNTNDTQEQITASPTTEQLYTVAVTDANGCVKENDITINVYGPLELEVTAQEEACFGDEITVEINYGGGNNGPYTLSTGTGQFITEPYIFNPENIGLNNYTITINDLCSTPPISSAFEIDIKALPSGEIISADNKKEGCVPYNVEFKTIPTNNQVFTEYNWDFGDYINNNSHISSPIHSFETPGTYDISVEVVSDNKCKSIITNDNYITAHPNPEANFIPHNSVMKDVNPLVYFENTSLLNDINYWDFGDENESNTSSLDHLYAKLGKYNVTLKVETINGCTDEKSTEVNIIEQCTFYAPTCFTPGSSDINYKFYVFGKCIDPDHFKMIIFDRWGEAVFETDRYSKGNPILHGWDGRIKKGEYGETGVYKWFVEYFDKNNARHTESGNIVIIK